MGSENNLAQMIIMKRQCVENKNHVTRSRSQSTLKICAYTSVKPVCVQPITLLCIVEFENNLAQMIIMTRQCVTNNNHVSRSKFKVTVST